MEIEDDAEIHLARASGNLLSDLELHLPRLLWKPAAGSSDRPEGTKVHQYVQSQDLDFILQLVLQHDPIHDAI